MAVLEQDLVKRAHVEAVAELLLRAGAHPLSSGGQPPVQRLAASTGAPISRSDSRIT